MRVYLIGYMGCGKSSVAKKLAAKLGYKCIDLDRYIEKHEGESIPDIFAKVGEEGFRKIERRHLNRVSEIDMTVIATGGGTPCFENNIELINSSGISIYLKMNCIDLVNRLMDAKTERPLLKGKNKNELFDYITSQLEKRAVFYGQAKYTLAAKGIKINQLIEIIKNKN